MKKLLLVFALFIGVASFYNTTEAQNINVSINIGRQPAWGPIGYDYAGYYYFPDIDCYYGVETGMFYYMNRGRWMSARYLPYAYRQYDLYGMYKVVLNVREPWRYHNSHYRDYAGYRGYCNQVVIRDSRDMRYHDSRNNRVAWYSKNDRNSGHHNDYKSDYGRNNSRNNDKNYNNNNRTNNYSSNRNATGGNDNNKHSDYKKDNKGRGANENSQARPSSSRNGNSGRDSKATRSSSTKGDFRMASNTERTTRNR